MKQPFFTLSILLSPALAHAAISLTGPSTDWVSLGANYDFLDDQQTGQADSDIVGSATDPGFFTSFDDLGTESLVDGNLGFRVRFDENGTQGSSIEFSTNLWIGIDANIDGTIDAFVAVNTQGGGSDTIEIRDAGGGLNNSPSTTSILNSTAFSTNTSVSNYNYRAVDFTLDGGFTNDLTPATSSDPDYYVSFLVDFSELVGFLGTQGISIDETSTMQYVVATSTQVNSLNQDIGGLDGNDSGFDDSTLWGDTDGLSPQISVTGVVVPEPSSLAIILGAGVLGCLRRRRI